MSRFNCNECAPGCRSRQHGSQITAAIIRGTEEQSIAYIKNMCHRGHLITDASGKTALHTAASCGKRKVVRWLLAQGVPMNSKDWESGYTPLHRALFYGQVHVAVALIQAGANMSALDHDALTPLDHINFDRPPVVSFTFSLPKHVYVWGSNANFNLGQTHQRARDTPEWLELLHREGQVIDDVSLNKFHTLFLSTSGRVYACGHGHGGRLGIDITAPVITPRPVKALMQSNVVKVAAGPDHSLFLTDTGQVWTCGTNSYHQLGINPPPESIYTPKLLTWHKNHKEVIVGIGAGRYHSVIWTTRVLYSFGLNAGQLGHFKIDNERTIINPRSVTSIVLREEGTLACVGVSDGATVVSTSFGDVYVLHQYQTRKVASRMIGVVKVACIGGHLDSRVGADGLTERGGTSLKIAVLVGGGVGHLYLWTEDTSHLSRCLFNISRKINLIDFCINTNSLAIVTDDGEAFSAVVLPPRERKANDKILGKPWGPSGKFNEFVDRSSCIMVRLTRIVALHRTIAIKCDPKGQNFAALQNEPNSFLLELPQVSPSTVNEDLGNLLQETDEEDSVHDVIIKCGNRKFPAHSYILANHSKYFKELLLDNEVATEGNSVNAQKVWGSLQDSEKKCLIVSDIRHDILQEVLTYIYSGSCKLTTLGHCKFKHSLDLNDINKSSSNQSSNWMPTEHVQQSIDPRQSAYSVYKEEEKQEKLSNKKKKKGKKNAEAKMQNTLASSKRPLEVSQNGPSKKPLQLLLSAARRLEITSLVQEVERLEMVDGYIQLKYSAHHRDFKSSHVSKYCRDDYQDLWDVMIQSKSGDVLGAHKCILAARLEYFRCMFSASWMEALSSKSLSMPLPTSILALLLDYLYEDDSPKLHYCKDVEFLCNVLTVADQFLISRLREVCEGAIVGLLTLRNGGEILEFAVNYNADQLKITAMQFISLNLAAMLENGSLLSVSSDVLADLSKYYRQFIPRMSCRVITPFDHPPYAEELEQLIEEKPLTLPESEEDWEDLSISKGDKQQNSLRKKKRSRRNSQGDSRSRKTSTSSQLSVSSSDCDIIKDLEDDFETLDFDDLEDRNPSEFQQKNLGTEEKSSNIDLMEPLKENTEIISQDHVVPDPNTWQKVGKKKSVVGRGSSTPTDTPRESPVKENAAFLDKMDSPKRALETPSLMLSPTAFPVKTPDVSFESPEDKFPSLSDSFIKTSKTSHQAKSNKMNKLSQKQRKKQAAEAAAAAASSVDAPKITKPSIPTSPWGSSSAAWGSNGNTSTGSDGIKKSHTLADIIKAEEASLKAKQVSAPINIQSAKKAGISGETANHTRRSWGNGSTPPIHQLGRENDGSGPWSHMATSPISSPVSNSLPSPGTSFPFQQDRSTPSFSKILLEEETFMGNLLRERSKPLSLIQLEDRAIEELLAFYGANECFEEKITVTRVRTALANPTWKKS